MTIIEMREKRAKLWNTMEGFLDTHRNDKGVLSAEDDATYSAMEQDLNDLSNEIRRMERRDAMEAELNKPVGKPLTGMPENLQEPMRRKAVRPMPTRKTSADTFAARLRSTTCFPKAPMQTAAILCRRSLSSRSSPDLTRQT